MLTGKRLYAPLNLLNELIDLEQTLEEIDVKLVQL
jgi:hypothetical protein